MIPGVTRGAIKTVLMAGAGLFLITEILKELSFSNSLNGEWIKPILKRSLIKLDNQTNLKPDTD
jgi:hypothetical protein